MSQPDTMLLWDDNPSSVDLLGFDDVAAPILGAIRLEHLDPVCVGVFGPWGSGKTTVLTLVRQDLEADDSVVVVYTQPWAYDPTTDPKATLIGEVLSAVRTRVAKDQGKLDQLRDKLKSLASRVRWSRAIRLAASSALTASLPKVSDLEAIFGQDDEIAEPALEGFRADFASLLAAPELADVARVIVIVDDLDRCLPSTIVETLEAIKLFLSVRKMAFIVAADEKAVTFALARHIGGGDSATTLAERYLDKIVQIPVRVPTLGLADVEAYIAQLLLTHRLAPVENGAQLHELVRTACAAARAAADPSLLSSVPAELIESVPGVAEDLALAARFGPILHEELDGNPRRIKRFLNAYWVRAAIARSRGLDFEVAAFAKLVLLEEVFPNEFGIVLSWLSAGTLDEQLRQLEDGEGEFPPKLVRWSQLDPPLATLGIGRYLVLAAAMTGTTVTADALPASLREIAARLVSPVDSERKAAQKAVSDLDESDRVQLARHLAEAIRFQPGRQSELSESLMAAVGSSVAAASEAATILRKVPTHSIQPSLVINLLPTDGNRLPPFRQVVEGWNASHALEPDTAKAIALALGGQ